MRAVHLRVGGGTAVTSRRRRSVAGDQLDSACSQIDPMDESIERRDGQRASVGMDGEPSCVGDARDGGDDPARADPAHPPLVEVGQVEVAGAVEHELGRLVDPRLPRGAFVAGRAGDARAREDAELARAKVEPEHLVAQAVRDVEGGAARLEVVRQTQAVRAELPLDPSAAAVDAAMTIPMTSTVEPPDCIQRWYTA